LLYIAQAKELSVMLIFFFSPLQNLEFNIVR